MECVSFLKHFELGCGGGVLFVEARRILGIWMFLVFGFCLRFLLSRDFCVRFLSGDLKVGVCWKSFGGGKSDLVDEIEVDEIDNLDCCSDIGGGIVSDSDSGDEFVAKSVGGDGEVEAKNNGEDVGEDVEALRELLKIEHQKVNALQAALVKEREFVAKNNGGGEDDEVDAKNNGEDDEESEIRALRELLKIEHEKVNDLQAELVKKVNDLQVELVKEREFVAKNNGCGEVDAKNNGEGNDEDVVEESEIRELLKIEHEKVNDLQAEFVKEREFVAKNNGEDDEVDAKNNGEDNVEESEMRELRELLKIEQEKVNDLQAELVKERAASATAAEEAMAMILRLQSEKSLLEREWSQYRRLAEEKQIHDQHVIRSLQLLVWQHEFKGRRLFEEEEEEDEDRSYLNGSILDALENVLYSSRDSD